MIGAKASTFFGDSAMSHQWNITMVIMYDYFLFLLVGIIIAYRENKTAKNIWGAAVIQRVVAFSFLQAVSLAVHIILQNLLYSLVILTRPGSQEVYF